MCCLCFQIQVPGDRVFPSHLLSAYQAVLLHWAQGCFVEQVQAQLECLGYPKSRCPVPLTATRFPTRERSMLGTEKPQSSSLDTPNPSHPELPNFGWEKKSYIRQRSSSPPVFCPHPLPYCGDLRIFPNVSKYNFLWHSSNWLKSITGTCILIIQLLKYVMECLLWIFKRKHFRRIIKV